MLQVSDHDWHHAAWVYDGQSLLLYTDGRLIRKQEVSGRQSCPIILQCICRCGPFKAITFIFNQKNRPDCFISIANFTRLHQNNCKKGETLSKLLCPHTIFSVWMLCNLGILLSCYLVLLNSMTTGQTKNPVTRLVQDNNGVRRDSRKGRELGRGR